MRDKSFKYKANRAMTEQRKAQLTRIYGHDERLLQFALWADGTWLDVSGLGSAGGPIFRPAICAWEAWKAAWPLRAR